MDNNKPPAPPSSKRIVRDFDPAPAPLDELVDAKPQRRPGQIEPCRSGPADGPVVAYYRNEAEVREGFLMALGAMGVAVVERHEEPAISPVRNVKP
jgi:hypothetical protein